MGGLCMGTGALLTSAGLWYVRIYLWVYLCII